MAPTKERNRNAIFAFSPGRAKLFGIYLVKIDAQRWLKTGAQGRHRRAPPQKIATGSKESHFRNNFPVSDNKAWTPQCLARKFLRFSSKASWKLSDPRVFSRWEVSVVHHWWTVRCAAIPFLINSPIFSKVFVQRRPRAPGRFILNLPIWSECQENSKQAPLVSGVSGKVAVHALFQTQHLRWSSH